MRKIWLVLKREYKTRVFSKGFLFSTIAIPVLFGGMMVFEAGLSHSRQARTFKIAILDETGGVSGAISEGSLIAANLSVQKLPDGQPEFIIEPEADPASVSESRARLDGLVRGGALDGYLWMPAGADASPELIEGTEGLLQSSSEISHAVTNARIARRLQSYGVQPERLESLLRPVDVIVTKLTKGGRQEDKGQGGLIATVMAILLYIALLMYGIITMRSVLEEKTTRTMEALISSARPIELMTGKILGVGSVGLTQFLIWAISAGSIAAYGAAFGHIFGQSGFHFTMTIPTSLLACAVIFFFGGYLLFASIYAAIGAVVSDPNDAQQLQMPVTLILVASFLLFPVVARDPSSTTAIILTLIPFFSPILMTFRIGIQTPPLWQIVLSMAILWLTTAGIIYAAARIYRVGVLMYGKRPSLVEVMRWMRYS